MFKLFCKHDWKILSETTHESINERTIKLLREEGAMEIRKLPWQLCDGIRKNVVICSCDKCGKIKRFVTEV